MQKSLDISEFKGDLLKNILSKYKIAIKYKRSAIIKMPGNNFISNQVKEIVFYYNKSWVHTFSF